MQERIRETPDLYAALPSADSLLMARRHNNSAAITEIETSVVIGMNLVTDFTFPLTPEIVSNVIDTAARAGSKNLFSAARLRVYLDYDNLLFQLSSAERAELFDLESKLYLNLAIENRDKAADFNRRGKVKQATKCLIAAQDYYDFSIDGYGMWPSPLDDDSSDQHEVDFDFEDNSMVQLFFQNEVCYAADEIEEELYFIRRGEQTVEGVDTGWELVRYFLWPRQEDYPQAYDGYNFLLSTIAQKRGVEPEQVDRYLEWRSREDMEREDSEI